MTARLLRSALAAGIGALALFASPATAAVSPPSLSVRAGALVAQDTGQSLYGQNASAQLAIASTTKLMTAYVALKDLPIEKIVRAQPYEPEYGESLMIIE